MGLTVAMLLVGLTGGIGSGKSAVAQRLASHGAVVIDADRLARAVVEPGTEGLAAVVEAFGSEVLDVSGALDRGAMARRVFGDEAARRRLEEIVHPLVRRRSAELVAAAPPETVVVNDVPLLVETGLANQYDVVLVVVATEQTRIDRLVSQRGMSAPEARARIVAQATEAQRRAVADVLIDNDGSLEELYERVDTLWTDRLLPAARSAG